MAAAGAVLIVGSGLIGRSWAMLFASGGFQVKLYDVEPQQIANALESIRKELKLLEQAGSLKGSLGAQEQLALIRGCTDIREAVEGAMHIQEHLVEPHDGIFISLQLADNHADYAAIWRGLVILHSDAVLDFLEQKARQLFRNGSFSLNCCPSHECVPENLELKQKLFAQLDGLVDDSVVLSSSSSCLLPSKLFTGLAHVQQCLVAHPVNPPYYVPLVELVPHPETAPATVDRTHALMRQIGQSPVRMLREVDGFALNRLQYAVIAEAWRLVQEGVVSPEDLDLVMSDGLGMRYAFIGPLETMHLNAEGMLSYCDRYGEGMKRVLGTFGSIPEFSGVTVEKVHQAMCAKVPADPQHLAARRKWRDQCLMQLSKLKGQMPPQ